MQQEVVCIHYWMVDTPSGSNSKAECKKCGEKSEFSNSPTFGYNYKTKRVSKSSFNKTI